tara:strand:- start:256 stop:462 length:207 start_codon:yes stop_codon:yes gene_type:complete
MSKDKKKPEAVKHQKTQFDKFIDDQIRRQQENKKRMQERVGTGEDTPQQTYNKLYRERPQNRTVWRKK